MVGIVYAAQPDDGIRGVINVDTVEAQRGRDKPFRVRLNLVRRAGRDPFLNCRWPGR
jgi:hypothetical protein